MTSALIALLELGLIQTNCPNTVPDRYAIAIPTPPRLGDGAPLVTYPIILASSESESITGWPGLGDGPLEIQRIADHFSDFLSDSMVLSLPMNSWSMLSPNGTDVSALFLDRKPSGRFESTDSPRPGQ